MPTVPPGLEPIEDLSPSLWVQEALKDWPSTQFLVRDLIPPVFETYARILHRPRRPDDIRDATGTWAEHARERNVDLRPETRWEELELSGEHRWSLHEGSVSEGEMATLVDLLGLDAGDCWFAVWSGFAGPGTSTAYLLAGGSLRQRVAGAMIRLRERTTAGRTRKRARRRPTFALLGGGRSYLLFSGSIHDAIRIHREFQFHPPTLWWPQDRAWFVHTEIDASSTYVGGSAALIGRLVGEQILESFEVDVEDPAIL
jgi:hypothetical protein